MLLFSMIRRVSRIIPSIPRCWYLKNLHCFIIDSTRVCDLFALLGLCYWITIDEIEFENDEESECFLVWVYAKMREKGRETGWMRKLVVAHSGFPDWLNRLVGANGS